MADLADGFVAVGAGLVAGLAGAGDRREGAVEHADDMADLDLLGRHGKAIAAELALAAMDEAGIAHFGQDGVEEFLRDIVARRDVIDKGELAGRQFGQR